MNKIDYTSKSCISAILAWKNASADLELVRVKDIETANTCLFIASTSELFINAVKNSAARASSGLVQQQALFMKFRKNCPVL